MNKKTLNKNTKTEQNGINNILRKFQLKTSLHEETYIKLMENAENLKLDFKAQFAQGLMAYLFFKGKKEGFFIDIGANNGYNGNATLWAEQLGWQGICAEPQKDIFEQLRKNRRCTLVNRAISNKTQNNVEFILFPEKNYRSGIASTMTDEHIIEAKTLSSMSSTTVDTITFNEMMIDFPNLRYIDFLKIDTEGHEQQVLQSIDFNKYSFGFITIETEEDSEVAKFTEQQGYKKLLVAGSDVIFVPTEYKIKQICHLFPFSARNIYIDMMKTVLNMIDIVTVPADDIEIADFVWYHWIENKYEDDKILPHIQSLAASGKKIIWNLHNKIPHNAVNISKAKKFMLEMLALSYKIVIHSNETINVIKELGNDYSDILGKTVYVPHPHYSGVYGSEKPAGHLTDNKLNLCFLGFLKQYKNIELLIDSINELGYDDIELKICGNGKPEYIQELENLAKNSKNIKTDFRYVDDNEIPEIASNCHLFISPYNLDSSLNSGVTIMAFSYARSMISPLTGTLNDIEDKSMFFAYTYNNPSEHKEELKKKISSIRSIYKGRYNDLINLGKKCKEYVDKNNTLGQVANRLMEVFYMDKTINTQQAKEKLITYNEPEIISPESVNFKHGAYYSPIPSMNDIMDFNFDSPPPTSLPGIDLNDEEQLCLLDQFESYYHEIPFPDEKSSKYRFYHQNNMFYYSDAILLYCMIRHLKPSKIIEVGSGFSSALILDTNEHFMNNSIHCTFIEPYPKRLMDLMKKEDKEKSTIINKRLQDVPLSVFKELLKNDILFIDSSHVSKFNSDVNYLIHKILPLLSDGVYIQFHDVFYPFEYPKEWMYRGRAWNEQYILRSFLQYNNAFKIAMFNTYLQMKFISQIDARFPLLYKERGQHYKAGCIWLKKVSKNERIDYRGNKKVLTKIQIMSNHLLENLSTKNWQDKHQLYSQSFESVEYKNIIKSPKMSIIIVSWKYHDLILQNIVRLKRQIDNDVEIIFVNNGGDENQFENVISQADIYVRLKTNTRTYIPRNVGSVFASAPLLLFLEDDCIPSGNLLKSHISLHNDYDILLATGRVETTSPDFQKSWHNNLSNQICYFYNNFEGNVTFDSKVFYEVGGWDDEIVTGGGVEISLRILARYPEYNKQVYAPELLIFHNYVKEQERVIT